MIVYKTKSYVDTETGELQNGILNTEEMLRNQEKQRQRMRAKKAYERKATTGDTLAFTFGLMENIKDLLEELDQNERTKRTYKGYILQLQTYTNYENELYLNKQSSKPLNRTGIAKVLGINNRTKSKQFIDLMLELGVLFHVKTDNGKAFVMNKEYSLKGKTRNKEIIKIFNESVRQVFKENSADDVAFLYALLPYVSYEDNVLAHNPHEQNPSKLDVLTSKDIAQLTGVSVDTVYRKKDRMTFNNLAVFKTETKLGKTNYVINPLVFYRKPYEPSDSIVRSFMVEGK